MVVMTRKLLSARRASTSLAAAGLALALTTARGMPEGPESLRLTPKTRPKSQIITNGMMKVRETAALLRKKCVKSLRTRTSTGCIGEGKGRGKGKVRGEGGAEGNVRGGGKGGGRTKD